VRKRVSRWRKWHLRQIVAETVSNAAEVDDELRHLIRIVSQSPL
jgi:hypothetical protein